MHEELLKAPNEFFKGVTMFGKDIISHRVATGLYKGTFGKVGKAVEGVIKIAPKPIQKSLGKAMERIKTLKGGIKKGFSIYGNRFSKKDKNFVDDVFKIGNVRSKKVDAENKLLNKVFNSKTISDDQSLRLTNAQLDNKKIDYLGNVKTQYLKREKELVKNGLPEEIALKLKEKSPKQLNTFTGNMEKAGIALRKRKQDTIDNFAKTGYDTNRLDPIGKLTREMNSPAGKNWSPEMLQKKTKLAVKEIRILEAEDQLDAMKRIASGKSFKEGAEDVVLDGIDDMDSLNKELLLAQEDLMKAKLEKFKLQDIANSDFKLRKFVTKSGGKPTAKEYEKFFRKEMIDSLNIESKQISIIDGFADIRINARKYANGKDLNWEHIATGKLGKKVKTSKPLVIKGKKYANINEFYLDDIEKLARKYGDEAKYKNLKGTF